MPFVNKFVMLVRKSNARYLICSRMILCVLTLNILLLSKGKLLLMVIMLMIISIMMSLAIKELSNYMNFGVIKQV